MVETTRIFPSPPSSLSASTPARDVVSNITGPLDDIPIGDIIEGKVLSQDSKGRTALETKRGIMNFSSQLKFPLASTLILRILAKGNNFQARIISVNGSPIANYIKSAQQESFSNNKEYKPKTQIPLPDNRKSNKKTTPTGKVQTKQPIGQRFRQFLQTNYGDAVKHNKTNTTDSGNILKAILVDADIPAVHNLFTKTGNILTDIITFTDTTPDANHNKISLQKMQAEMTRPGNGFIFKIIEFIPPYTSSTLPKKNHEAKNNSDTTKETVKQPQEETKTIQKIQIQETNTTQNTNNKNPTLNPNTAYKNYKTATYQTTNIQDTELNLDLASGKTLRMNAIAIGNEHDGETLIKTPIGNFHIGTEIQKGSMLKIELTNITVFNNTTNHTAITKNQYSPQNSIVKLLQHWQNFDDIYKTIITFNETTKAQTDVSTKSLPGTKGDFVAQLFAYMANIKNGNSEQWLGKEIIKILEISGRDDLIENIKHDFTLIKQLFTTPSQNGWHLLLFPIIHDGAAYQARLFVRDDEHGKDNKSTNIKGSRFLVELDLERFGAIQIDGLFIPKTQNNTLNLIIRNNQELPASTKSDITQIFIDAIQTSGITGKLEFQTTSPFPINPLSEFLQKQMVL